MNNVITFADNTSNTRIRKRGIKIGEYLVVAYEFEQGLSSRIYNIVSGKFALDIQFADKSDAEAVARFLDDQFGEYFPIWDIYPEADVFSLAKWSVNDGIKIVEVLKRLKDKEITHQDFEDMLKNLPEDEYKRLYFGRLS